MKTLQEFLTQRPTGPLYHYTDSCGLLGIFRQRELWATNVNHLNDANEFKHAHSLLLEEVQSRLQNPVITADARRIWTNLAPDLEKPHRLDSAVVSFSTAGNQLSQWRAYCPRGNGYSIGFSYADLSYARRKIRTILVKCVYEPSKQRELISSVADYMEKSVLRSERILGSKRIPGWGDLSFIHHAFRKVTAAMLAIKDIGFEEESEWRLVVEESAPHQFRSGRFGILPYSPVPLCSPSETPPFAEIFVGPHPEPGVAEDALVDFLRNEVKADRVHERMRQSAIPYRY